MRQYIHNTCMYLYLSEILDMRLLVAKVAKIFFQLQFKDTEYSLSHISLLRA
jgi:hypothetical protein